MANILFISILVLVSCITTHTNHTMARTLFKNLLPTLKRTMPIAAIGIAHAASQTVYAQGEKIDLHEKNYIQLSNFDQMVLRKIIQEKTQALLAETENAQQATLQTNPTTGQCSPYIIKSPTPLTDEEQAMPILERIGRKYIGELPKKITDIIAHFSISREITGKSMSNAVLLHGDPGDGKSFLVETLAQELQVDYLYCDAGSFINKYAGESSKNIVNFFSLAKSTKKPIFICIDEIDAIAVTRDGRPGEYRSALNTLLIQVHSLAFNPNVFIFIATNTAYDLDPAIKSRFNSRSIKIDKIKKKDDYLAFFNKSLRDHGFAAEEENQKIASEIYTELNGWIFKTKFSRRDLSALIPNALARKHSCENLNKDTQQELSFYVKQIIKETKKGIELMEERPRKPQQ